MEVKNYLQEIVERTADKLIGEDPDVCQCKQCRADIITYSLNHLKPKYAINVKGHALTAVDIESEQVQTEVTVKVLEAIKMVKEHPHH